MNYSRHFITIAVLFVAVLMISNTVASKIIAFGPLFLTGAIILFPVSYIFGDILTEVYGYRESRRIIWLGFAAQLLMSVFYTIVQILPPAPFWPHQESYASILGVVPRIVVASLIAYICGEFINSFVLSRLKVRMNGRHLWIRTIGSTLLGEGIDTALFVTIAFAGILPLNALIVAGVSGYAIKVLYEVAATPLTYMIVKYLKRIEQKDVLDIDVNYNPFALK